MKTEWAVRRELYHLYEAAGTLKSLGERLGYSASYLHDVLQERKPISKALARKLGYRIHVKTTITRTYEALKQQAPEKQK